MSSLTEGIVANFNDAMRAFLYQLTVTFPEQKDVASFFASFDAFVALMPSKPMDVFMEAMTPHAPLLMARDPALFAQLDFPGIDFRAMWESPGVTDATHDAIWEHLNVLYTFGSVGKGVSPEVASMVEDKLKACLTPDNKLDADKVSALLPRLVADLQGSGAMDSLKDKLDSMDIGNFLKGMEALVDNVDPAMVSQVMSQMMSGINPSAALAGFMGGGGGGEDDDDPLDLDVDLSTNNAYNPAAILNMLRGMDSLMSSMQQPPHTTRPASRRQ